MPKAGKYKWLSSLRVLVYNACVYLKSDIYIQINNKTIFEFGPRRICETSALIIPHVLLDLIQ